MVCLYVHESVAGIFDDFLLLDPVLGYMVRVSLSVSVSVCLCVCMCVCLFVCLSKCHGDSCPMIDLRC